MYCKKCGTQIDNDSEFCRKCGTKTTPISPDIKKPNTQTTTTNIASKNSSSTFNVLFKFFIFVVIAFFIFAGVMKCVKEFDDKGSSINNTSTSSNKNPIQQLITRDANNNDIEFETETNYKKLGVDVKIHPNCDIEDLVIKIEIPFAVSIAEPPPIVRIESALNFLHTSNPFITLAIVGLGFTSQ